MWNNSNYLQQQQKNDERDTYKEKMESLEIWLVSQVLNKNNKIKQEVKKWAEKRVENLRTNEKNIHMKMVNIGTLIC